MNQKTHLERRFAKLAFVAAVALVLSFRAAKKEPPVARPNIVLILADDMGYGDPGCYNKDSKIPTPNLDRLASEGMRFTDAHTPSAVCSPTRYGLLTGRYAWRTRLHRGVLWGYSASLIDTNRLTLASLMKRNGYETAGIGKWHLGFQKYDPARGRDQVDYSKPLRPGPNDLGFDYFFGIPASLDMQPYLYVENDRPVAPPVDSIAASEHRRKNGGGFWRAGPIAPGFRHIEVLPILTNKAVQFIEQQKDKPFFLYLALTAPHTPWLPTAEFRGKSAAGYYGDFCVQVDWTVGRIMETLSRLNLADNTLLIFTSDNGSHWPPGDIEKWNHAANGPWRGQKADIWEGGHRVPFIARWPGKIAPATTSDQTICLTDMMATFAGLLGQELPENAGEDSCNLLPILLDRVDSHATETNVRPPIREAIVHHSSRGMFALRQGPWKLILGRGSGGFSHPREIEPKPGEPKGQLYNLSDDPAESKNQYLDHPEIVQRLSALLEQYRQQGYSRR